MCFTHFFALFSVVLMIRLPKLKYCEKLNSPDDSAFPLNIGIPHLIVPREMECGAEPMLTVKIIINECANEWVKRANEEEVCCCWPAKPLFISHIYWVVYGRNVGPISHIKEVYSVAN